MPLTAKVLEEVFAGVGAGKSLRSQLDAHKIHYEQFYRELDGNEALSERYARARRHQAESSQNRILDAVDRVLEGELDPNAARVAIDALKWNAARLHPAIYGERVAHEHGGPNGGAIIVELEMPLPKIKLDG